MSEPKFYIGQIVQHLKFDYRGVVFAVDGEFALSQAWYEQVARSLPPKEQPWYHVLVDGAVHTTYVAERHLAPTEDVRQIDHPELGRHFSRYDGIRYFPAQTPH